MIPGTDYLRSNLVPARRRWRLAKPKARLCYREKQEENIDGKFEISFIICTLDDDGIGLLLALSQILGRCQVI